MNTKGTVVLHERLFEIFGNCRPSKDYINLSKLPLYRIYSLNIDDSLESTLSRFSPNNYNVLSRNDFVIDVSISNPTLSLIKLNGDIRNPSLGFIFSASEYAKETTKNNKWYEELARDFNRYTLLFIGTQLNEPLLRFHIEQYQETHNQAIQRPTSYLLTPSLSKFDEINFKAANIEHIKGTMASFDSWIDEHLNDMPNYENIAKLKRPYMGLVNSKSDLNPEDLLSIGYSITDLQEVISSTSNTNNQTPTTFSKFYQGFKPSWQDIANQIPSQLTKINNFYNINFIESTPLRNSLYLVYGAAGSGKTTSIMQIAYNLKKNHTNNVYFIDRNYQNLLKIVEFLEKINDEPYYVLIDKIIQGYDELSEIIKTNKFKSIFIVSEDIKIWEYKAKEYLGEHLTKSIDISSIDRSDVPLILDKIKSYGKWTRLAKMSQHQREKTLYSNSKSQLLIGLLETTSGKGYEDIIFNDFNSIKANNEKSLLLLTSIASVENLPSSETTLLKALEYLGYTNQSIHYLVSRKLAGILSYNNGLVTTRHRTYSNKLFDFIQDKSELQKIIIAYIHSFTSYEFPIVTAVKSKSEANNFKHLVNFKFLNKILHNNKDLVLEVYRSFEKKFELEGLFLMQYGLALRSFKMHYEALDILSTALDAYPESNHIGHALAQQKLIIAYEYPHELRSSNYLTQAIEVLLRLSRTDMKGNHDKYPIVTLSKGHIQFLLIRKEFNTAREKASEYSNLISKIPNWQTDEKLRVANSTLMKFATSNNNYIQWNKSFS